MVKSYDVCILCMNFIKNDARCLNLASTLTKLGKSIAVICFGDKDNSSYPFDIYPVNLDLKIRLSISLPLFYLKVRQLYSNLKADFYVGSELYSLPAARYLQKLWKGKLIYDSREIFSELGNTYKSPLQRNFFKYLELSLIKKVDKIIVSGALDAEYLKKHFKIDVPYHLVMNLPFYNEKVKSNKIREFFNIPDNYKILIYQGMIMNGRGLGSAVRILSQMNNCVLCVIGFGTVYREQVIKISKENGVEDRLYIKDFVPYKELHEWTCSADVGLSLFEPISLSYKLALPNKIFEYSLAGLPVLATNLPAINSVAKDFKHFRLANYPFQLEFLTASIDELLNMDKSLMVSSTSEFSKKFNYESQITEIQSIFEIK